MQKFSLSNLKNRFWAIIVATIVLSVAHTNTCFSREKDPVNAGTKTGIASWYGGKFHGRKTANGDIFDKQKLTCASNLYPLGTWLRVTNLRNGKSVIVLVNDRMHPRIKRVVDLSKGAAHVIGIEETGIGKVKVENMGK